MLTIRMQRKGRTGHAQFRVVVQDSRFSPLSGRVVAYVGSYDPHTKAATLNGEKISAYLANGAQPSDRVAKLLTKEGIKLPDWFEASAPKKKEVRNPDKRRSTRPEGALEPSPAQTSPDEVSAGQPKAEATAEEPAAEPAADLSADLPAETPVEDKTPDIEEPVTETETAAEPVAESKPEVEEAPKTK